MVEKIKFDDVSEFSIPASSSPWSTSGTDYNKQLVHYANSETNGAYYTWCAATAGTCSGAENNTDAKASSSICPRGWKLPTKAEYDTLLSNAGIANSSAGSTKIRGTPYNFPAAGRVVNGALQGVGSWSDYWSSTAYNSDSAYTLYFDSNAVATSIRDRYLGFSVRCIAL